MYMIIENAGLSDQETKFIFSDTLYDQTRNSMKKYMIGLSGEESSENSGIKLKTDVPVMYMNNRGKYIRPQAGSWRPNVPQYVPMNLIGNVREGGPQGYNQTAAGMED